MAPSATYSPVTVVLNGHLETGSLTLCDKGIIYRVEHMGAAPQQKISWKNFVKHKIRKDNSQFHHLKIIYRNPQGHSVEEDAPANSSVIFDMASREELEGIHDEINQRVNAYINQRVAAYNGSPDTPPENEEDKANSVVINGDEAEPSTPPEKERAAPESLVVEEDKEASSTRIPSKPPHVHVHDESTEMTDMSPELYHDEPQGLEPQDLESQADSWETDPLKPESDTHHSDDEEQEVKNITVARNYDDSPATTPTPNRFQGWEIKCLLLILVAVSVASLIVAIMSGKKEDKEPDTIVVLPPGIRPPAAEEKEADSTNVFFIGHIPVHNTGEETLELQSRGLSGILPSELGLMTTLRVLDLSNNTLYGIVPTRLGMLPKLEELDLSQNTLGGDLPKELALLTALKNLSLHDNEFYGTISPAFGFLSTLLAFSVANNDLYGSIPSEMGMMSGLEHLNISSNYLGWTLPKELGDMTNLQQLDLSSNGFSGSVPVEVTALSDLTHFDASRNDMTGTLTIFSNMTALTHLNMSSNNFNGKLPTEFGLMTALTALDLHSNPLGSTIPVNKSSRLLSALPNEDSPPQIDSRELQRKLQSDFDLDAFQFNFAGVSISAEDAINACPGPWQSVVSCIISDCPAFMDVCPRFTNPHYHPSSRGSAPSCEELEHSFCYEFGGEECCLHDCTEDLHSLVTCIIRETKGEDRSSCPALDCHSKTLDCGPGTILFKLDLLTDRSGSEVSWQLQNDCTSETVGSGSFYSSSTSHIEQFCIADGQQYTFTINDSGSDGICCSHGYGGYEVYIGGNLVQSGGSYSTRESATFGSCNGASIATIQFLEATIPTEFNIMTALSILDLRSVRLGSSIPRLDALTGLISLQLGNNRLTSSIPAELGKMTALEELDLSWNKLVGPLPNELGMATGLRRLDLSWNKLVGQLPNEFGMMSTLTELSLQFNALVTTLPSQLGSLTALTTLNLHGNTLLGTLPSEFGRLTALTELSLGHHTLTGVIPSSLGLMTGLTSLDLQKNQLRGSMPTELGLLTGLTSLDLENNPLLTGTFPIEIALLPNLTRLDLRNTGFTGTFPREVCESADVSLDCSKMNCPWECTIVKIGGVIIEGRRTNLEYYYYLDGTIPPSIGALTELTSLDFSYNHDLTGTIPSELGLLTRLKYLKLRVNGLGGSIPSELGLLTELRNLWLYGNQLTGSIPTELGQCTDVTWLSLNQNKISGSLPSELGLMTALTYLQMTHNLLKGEIPDDFGKLSRLDDLEIGYNSLTGTIPFDLCNNNIGYSDLYVWYDCDELICPYECDCHCSSYYY